MLGLASVATIVLSQAVAPAHAAEPSAGRSPADVSLTPPVDQARSRVLAGYAGRGGDAGVQMTFTVPNFACSGSESSSLLTGAFANSTPPGGPSSVNGGGGVFLICDGGAPRVRSALYDPTGQPEEAGAVAVGDRIRVTYGSDPAAAKASATLENLTQGYVTVTGPFEYVQTTDFQVGDHALTFDGTTGGPVPAAERTRVKPVKVDGQKIRRSSGLVRYRLVTEDGDPLRKPSRIVRAGFKIRPASS